MTNQRKAFTLIELLVVISIVALLISILLPVLGNARDVAKSLSCLSNLRQYGVAHGVYGSENDDTVVPPFVEAADTNVGGTAVVLWFELLADVMVGEKRDSSGQRGTFAREEMVCPAFDLDRPQSLGHTFVSSYGFNTEFPSAFDTSIAEYRPVAYNGNPAVSDWYRYGDVIEASNWAINGDSYEPRLAATVSGGAVYFRRNTTSFERRWRAGEPDRHSKPDGTVSDSQQQANYLFFDGHAENMAKEDGANATRRGNLGDALPYNSLAEGL